MTEPIQLCVVCSKWVPPEPYLYCTSCCAHPKDSDTVFNGYVVCGRCGMQLYSVPKPRSQADRDSDDAQTAWEKERGI